MKKILLLTILILSTTIIWAQKSKYTKVTVEDLKMEESKIDAEAAAEVLYQFDEVLLSGLQGKLTYRKHRKLKIYDKDKLDDAYLRGTIYINRFEQVNKLEFNTYNLENDKVVKTSKNKSNAIIENVNYYNDKYIYSFENVKNGSVVELIVEYNSSTLSVIGPFNIEEYLPVVRKEVFLNGYDKRYFVPEFNGEIFPSKVDTLPNSLTYHYENIKPYKDLPYVLSNNTIRSRLLVRLNYASTKQNNWNGIAQNLSANDWFGKELKNIQFFQEDVKKILAEKPQNISDTIAIFNHVQNHFTSLGVGNYTFSERNRELYKKQKASDGEINLILVCMLRAAGIDAYPIILSTTGNGVLNPYIPNFHMINNVIVGVKKAPNNYDLFDASSKYTKKNILTKKNLSGLGFSIEGEVAREVDLSNYTVSQQIKTISAAISPEGLMKGRYNHRMDNYYMLTEAESIALDPKGYEKAYMSGLISDYSNFKADLKDDHGRVSFDFDNLSAIDVVGNKMLINPKLFVSHNFQRLLEEKRFYPLEFFTPQSNEINVNLKIPNGYKVASLPEGKAYDYENGVSKYIYSIKENNGLLQITIFSTMNTPRIPADNFSTFKQYIEAIWDSTKDFIILEKI